MERLWTLDGGSIMLKRWRVSFDIAQDYFRMRHIWVLLPGLPLYLWNDKSLEAIENSLGRFISMGSKSLARMDKKVARILVEIDIHEGLLESIDIEWRGHLTCQKLNYLGIPFKCTFCRQTGHLRKLCTGFSEDEQSEDTMLEISTRLESPRVNSQATYTYFFCAGETTASNSITSKLKNICPSLFFSLTAWEKKNLYFSTILALGTPKTPRGDTPLARDYTSAPPTFTDTYSHGGI